MADLHFHQIFIIFILVITLQACGSVAVKPSKPVFIADSELFHNAVQAHGGRYLADPAIAEYVSAIGMRLARLTDYNTLPFEFVVINSDVPNSWGMVDGKIGVTRGLLLALENEAELATVLAHEIVHSALHNQHRGVSGGLIVGDHIKTSIFNDSYGRSDEMEADRLAIELIVRAGYDPQAAVDLQYHYVRRYNQQEPLWMEGVFANHIPSMERVAYNRQHASKYKADLLLAKRSFQDVIKSLSKQEKSYQLFKRGQKSLLAGDLEVAKSDAAEAVALNRREAAFHILLAESLSLLGDDVKAANSFDQGIALDTQNYASYLKRGLYYRRAGKLDQAQQDLEQSAALLPTAIGLQALGEVSQLKGDRASAMDYYQRASESQSRVGSESKQAFARLDFSDHPDRYLSITSQLDGGVVVFYITNKSSFHIKLTSLTFHTDKSYSILINAVVPAMSSVQSKAKVGEIGEIRDVVVKSAEVIE